MGSEVVRIALCVNHYHPLVGGAEEVSARIANHFAQSHEVFVLTRRVRSRNHNDYRNLSIIEYLPGDFSTFIEKLQTLNPDVIFVYSDVFDFFRHILTSSWKAKVFIALCGANWIHRGNRNFANMFMRSLSNIKRIICHSKYERDYKLCSNELTLPKTVVIPNGIDLNEFDSNTLSREDLAPTITGRRWVLNVSNFFPGKGQEHLIDLLSSIDNPKEIAYLQVSNDIEFPIGAALEIKWKKAVATRLDRLGITTKLLKNLPRDQVVGFFKQSNAFVFTSEKEVAPLVLLEAMASRLPWVSMDVGNALELKGGRVVKAVKNSEFHAIFDARVKDLMLGGLQYYFNTSSVVEDGRKQIESTFNWDVILPQYSKLIEQ